jgi:hypothetical protein
VRGWPREVHEAGALIGSLRCVEKLRPSLDPAALVIEIGKLDDSSLGMPGDARMKNRHPTCRSFTKGDNQFR